MTSPETEPITDLPVEDDPGDVVLVQEAFGHITVVKLPGHVSPPGN
jgi:hypothetical protein